ncbi:hypothetical protein [Chitinivorax sp. B]|uniref:hypothetical protein n=1 Tax=Chitinivorax sp. B TaxID=2502235 RepID=UPI0010F885B6|nr:hypothetical protein [Chitinivorax sp. B]
MKFRSLRQHAPSCHRLATLHNDNWTFACSTTWFLPTPNGLLDTHINWGELYNRHLTIHCLSGVNPIHYISHTIEPGLTQPAMDQPKLTHSGQSVRLR